MKKPSVSVIMSVYNGQQYLPEAVASILQQTHADFEFIITNDGSNDKTPSILDEYARQDSRIRIVHQENMGLTASLNRMVAMANGEFIARMDADDISFPDRFEKQLKKLEEKPDYLAVATWFQLLDEKDIPFQERVFPDAPELLRWHFQKGINSYAHGSAMIRKKVFDKLGYAYRFKYGQDFDLWLRLSEQYSLGMVEEILYRQRHHSNTLSKALIPLRAALMRLMLTLAKERKKNGKEISDWREEELKILKNIPLWNEAEIDAHNKFLEARRLLCAGENIQARSLLSGLKADGNSLNNLAASYYMSFFPGFLSASLLRWRDRINNERIYRRIPKVDSQRI